MKPIMSLHAKHGDKVRFHNEGGYYDDKVVALKYLKVGEIYTVDYITIGSFHSTVRLVECGEEAFNTAGFEDALEMKTVMLMIVLECEEDKLETVKTILRNEFDDCNLKMCVEIEEQNSNVYK